MIACLAIFLPPTLLFCISDSFHLASLSRSRLLFIRFIFLPQCACNTKMSTILTGLLPAHMKCAVRRAVNVILRRARERTIDITVHTHKYIYRRFPLNTTYRCSLARSLIISAPSSEHLHTSSPPSEKCCKSSPPLHEITINIADGNRVSLLLVAWCCSYF